MNLMREITSITNYSRESDLRCKFCEVTVKCDKKYFVESHRRSKRHQAGLEQQQASQSMQTFIEQAPTKKFTDKVVSADIPLHKLNHPALKSLFATTGESLPLRLLLELARQKGNEIQDL
ncbi:unnamed protein product, partial [Clavelina lepadiformis]